MVTRSGTRPWFKLPSAFVALCARRIWSARLGGDEFAVLARHLSGPEAATSLALRMIESLQAPVRAGGNEHRVGIGIGIALVPTDGIDSETLLRKADVALYRAKAENVSAMRFFEDAMDLHIRVRDRLERDLRAAIDGHGEGGVLEVLYQPRLDLKGGAVTGFEAQPNWNHPEFGPPRRRAYYAHRGIRRADRTDDRCNAARGLR